MLENAINSRPRTQMVSEYATLEASPSRQSAPLSDAQDMVLHVRDALGV